VFPRHVWDGEKIKTVIGEEEVAEIADDDIFWVDQASDDGELLWPAAFPRMTLQDAAGAGSPRYAGQYQQNPARAAAASFDMLVAGWDDEFAKESASRTQAIARIANNPGRARLGLHREGRERSLALSTGGVFRDKNDNPR